MFRSSLIVAGAALLCSTAIAQQRLDPARLHSINGPIKNAGTVDITTGKWVRPGTPVVKAGGIQTIFNNTCTWQTQGYYAGFAACERNYDEGRVPSTSSPGAPSGAQDQNKMDSFQISYCTFVATASTNNGLGNGYAMEVGFWDNLNGNCVGAIPPTPPMPSVTAKAYFDLSGIGMPGSTTNGFQACWLVTIDVSNTGWTLTSDGNGTFSNDPTVDKFTWSQSQHELSTLGGALGNPDGFLIVGEPLSGGYGACSYTIACGTDILFGNTCGTGLDAFDNSWINVDGIAAGSSTTVPPGNTACTDSVAQYGFGTNCYFFGGYPTNPFASYWLVLKSDRGTPTGALQFCTQTKATTVAGCLPTLSAADLTLATGTWNVNNVPLGPASGGATIGIFIYTRGVGIGQSGFSTNVNFGTLCLQPGTFLRSAPACSPVVISGGTPNTCSAAGFPPFSPNCNAGALTIAVGQDVNAQCWYRDPGVAGNANFTNAIYYTVQ